MKEYYNFLIKKNLHEEMESWVALGYIPKFLKTEEGIECVLLPKWEIEGKPIFGIAKWKGELNEETLKLIALLVAGHGETYAEYELYRRKLGMLAIHYF